MVTFAVLLGVDRRLRIPYARPSRPLRVASVSANRGAALWQTGAQTNKNVENDKLREKISFHAEKEWLARKIGLITVDGERRRLGQ